MLKFYEDAASPYWWILVGVCGFLLLCIVYSSRDKTELEGDYRVTQKDKARKEKRDLARGERKKKRDEKRAYRANLVEEAKKLKAVAAATAINKVASAVTGDNANKNGDNNTNQVKVEINPASSNSISSPQTSEPSPTPSNPIDVGSAEATSPAGADIGPDPFSTSPLDGLMPGDIS